MRKGNSNRRFLSFSIIWLIAAFFVCGIIKQAPPVVGHTVVTILLISSYVLCLYYWLKAGNRVLSLYTFFILYAFFSNAGQSLLYLAQFPDEFLNVYDDGTLTQIVDMLRFQYLCIAAMGVGTAIYLSSSRFVPIRLEAQRNDLLCQGKFKGRNDSLLWFGLLFCLVYVLFFAVKMVSLRQTMGYGDLYEARGEWNSVFHQVVNLLALLLSYYFLFRNKNTVIIYVFLVLILLSYMISGSRGLAIPYLGMLIVVFPITNPELFKRRYAVFWIIGGIVFFSLLSVISSNRAAYLTGQALNTTNTIAMNAYATISEMGMSARTVTLTMQAIDNGGMEHHQTILYVLTTSLVPLTNNIPALQDQYIQLSSWVSEFAGSYNSGLGYSFIAEAYMNYGWFGWIYILIYGWFIAFAESLAYRRISNGKYYLALMLLVILSKQLFYARAQIELIGGTLRLLEYLTIIYLIFFNSNYERKTHRKKNYNY